MRAVRATQEFRMELRAHHEGVIFDLDDLREACLPRAASRDLPSAGEEEARILELLFERIIEFVTMSVTF